MWFSSCAEYATLLTQAKSRNKDDVSEVRAKQCCVNTQVQHSKIHKSPGNSARFRAVGFGRTIELFMFLRTAPTPSPRESMKIFNEAILVVGPHGAGLSNLVYCEPGTFVIEGVCNPPHVNMCYQRTAHILGHHYHAVDSSSGCESVVNVEPSEIIKVAEIYLTIASTEQSGK